MWMSMYSLASNSSVPTPGLEERTDSSDSFIASKKPLVSVITVTYNSSKFIAPCLQSVLDSDYPLVEVIVVDNDSKDDTVAIIREEYKSIVLMESRTNLRYGAGNNLGIKSSHGELIFLLNPDATIRKDCISAIVNAWLEDSTIGIIGCKVYYSESNLLQSVGGTINISGKTRLLGDKKLDTGQFEVLRNVQWVSGAAMMISRQALRRIGLFDPIYYLYYEETDLCWRARKAGMRVICLPTAIAYHFGGHATRSASLLLTRYMQASRVVFVLKNYELSMLVIWLAKEAESLLSNLFHKMVHDNSRSSLRNIIFAYFYALTVLPQILLGRSRNRRITLSASIPRRKRRQA